MNERIRTQLISSAFLGRVAPVARSFLIQWEPAADSCQLPWITLFHYSFHGISPIITLTFLLQINSLSSVDTGMERKQVMGGKR